MSDYSDASSRATTLDNQITQSAQSVSSEYSDLVSLAARQTFGSIDITVSRGSDGQWNTSDAMIFMKNMGNNRSVLSARPCRATLIPSLQACQPRGDHLRGFPDVPLRERIVRWGTPDASPGVPGIKHIYAALRRVRHR